MKREVRTTADGSKTLYVAALDENYHSYHGAIQEAQHVFLKMGVDFFPVTTPLKILEIGFGTGLNAFLTFFHIRDNYPSVLYEGVEGFPVLLEEAQAMDYPAAFDFETGKSIFQNLHESPWEKKVSLSNSFTLKKIESDFISFSPEREKYNLIYFDAFAPDAQPELWSVSQFQKMYDCLEPGGILVTYSAKGQVRRNLIEVGFEVEKVPGPPGKREMLRGRK